MNNFIRITVQHGEIQFKMQVNFLALQFCAYLTCLTPHSDYQAKIIWSIESINLLAFLETNSWTNVQSQSIIKYLHAVLETCRELVIWLQMDWYIMYMCLSCSNGKVFSDFMFDVVINFCKIFQVILSSEEQTLKRNNQVS